MTGERHTILKTKFKSAARTLTWARHFLEFLIHCPAQYTNSLKNYLRLVWSLPISNQFFTLDYWENFQTSRSNMLALSTSDIHEICSRQIPYLIERIVKKYLDDYSLEIMMFFLQGKRHICCYNGPGGAWAIPSEQRCWDGVIPTNTYSHST